jgi:hypothetical protein
MRIVDSYFMPNLWMVLYVFVHGSRIRSLSNVLDICLCFYATSLGASRAVTAVRLSRGGMRLDVLSLRVEFVHELH